MLTGLGEWCLLRGDLYGDCAIFCGDDAAFAGDAADLLGDLRGLAEFYETTKNNRYVCHFREYKTTQLSVIFHTTVLAIFLYWYRGRPLHSAYTCQYSYTCYK